MSRKSKLILKLEGPQGSGKTIILNKFCAYLNFFDIETIQVNEHEFALHFNQSSLKALREAK